MERKPLQGAHVVHVLVRLRPRLHRQLKARSRAEDRPMSIIIREAISKYLEAQAS